MILVGGGAGYLGSWVIKALDCDCTVYDSLLYRNEYREPCRFVRGDVRDYVKLDEELSHADCVVWLAAIVGDGPCMVNPAMTVAVNVDAVKHLADVYDGPIIFTSTASVYGWCDGLATERTPVNPLSIYAESKLAAEMALIDKALILRLGTLYGLSDRMRFDLIVNQFALQAHETGSIKVMGGSQCRPLLSVQEAGDLIASLARECTRIHGIYNVASSNHTVLDVADIVATCTDTTIEMLPGMDDNRSYTMDSSRARRTLGFVPKGAICDSVMEIDSLLSQGRFRNPYAACYYNMKVLQNEASSH